MLAYIHNGGDKRKMIAKSTREAVEDEILKNHDQPQKPTLNSLYQEWHPYKSAKVTTTTMCNIDSYWIRFYENISIIRVPLDRLDYITLDKWAHDIVNHINSRLSNTAIYIL